MREWLVIEDSGKHMVFASEEKRNATPCYIPHDVAECILGRNLGGDRYVWFSREEGELLRACPEWRDSLPPGRCVNANGNPTADSKERGDG